MSSQVIFQNLQSHPVDLYIDDKCIRQDIVKKCIIGTIEGEYNYEIKTNWMYAWYFAKSKKLLLQLKPNEIVTINYGINQPWVIRLIFISTVILFGLGLYSITFIPEVEQWMGEYKFLFQISVFIIPQLILGFMNYYNRKLYIFERKSIEN